MYEVLCKLHGLKFKKWKFDNNLSLNIKDLKKIINKRTKVIFLVNPNLPIEYEFNKKFKNEDSIENFLQSNPNIKTFITNGFYNSTIGAIHSLSMKKNYNICVKEKNIFKKKIFENLVEKVYSSKIPIFDAFIVGLIEDQEDLFKIISENNFKKIIFIEEQSASLFLNRYKIEEYTIFIDERPTTKKVELLVKRLMIKSIEITALVSHVIPIQDAINAYQLYKKENTTSIVLKP